MVLNTEGAKINSDWEYIWKDWELIKINWDIAVFSTVWENGFKLETGNINIKEIKEQTKELKEEYKWLMESWNGYYKNVELKNKIIEIKNNGWNDEDIWNLLNENWFNTIEDLNEEIELQKEEYNDKKEDYLKSSKEIKNYVLKEKKKLEELEKEQKETLKFLSKIGFDMLPQHITNQLIENINLAPNDYWFNTKIDLENGILWFKQMWVDNLGVENKRKFMNIFIKAIWNPEWLFNTWNIWNNSSIIKEPMNLQTHLNKEWYFGVWVALKMKNNLSEKKK
jgi:hypothetical protein